MNMLEVSNLSISFGGLKAVSEFNLTIKKGQLYGLIGPNGAGKTTVFNMLTGVYKADTGSIILDGTNITKMSTIEANRAGIARTFQNIRLFKELSVIDNVKVGLHNHHSYSTFEGVFRLPKYFKVEKEIEERARKILENKFKKVPSIVEDNGNLDDTKELNFNVNENLKEAVTQIIEVTKNIELSNKQETQVIEPIKDVSETMPEQTKDISAEKEEVSDETIKIEPVKINDMQETQKIDSVKNIQEVQEVKNNQETQAIDKRCSRS